MRLICIRYKMVYIDILDDIVGEYNNTCHGTIKMKPIDVKDNTFVDSMEFHSKKEVNDKDSKSKVGDHVRISKLKNIFATGYILNWSEEVFIRSKIRNTVPWTYIINYLNGKKIIGTFYEKKTTKDLSARIQNRKSIKRKGDKLYVEWKGYDNFFNNWVDKKDLV